ncbi:coiled-coil domain-containing protein 142-like [Tyto alba]|uniref:coiled-coil domain-containing protein 142-like n=1 Tax=Tyto alba TaxID=56313 RepID=UPI001C663394|nr:coiled-coil domain-containing protein 142-like [Tyto alba]
MEDGSPERGGAEPRLQAAAPWGACPAPCPWPRPRCAAAPAHADSNDSSEDEEEEAPSFLAPLEQSLPGLRHCLGVWWDPRSQTFRAHARPPPGTGTFSYHPVHPRLAERAAALHALLRHRHRLRLTRRCGRWLRAASRLLRRFLALPEPPAGQPGAAPPLRDLCRELRAQAGRWGRLRGCEAPARVRRALLPPALHAARLAERHAEARLRALGHGPPAPALLCDLFQGLEIYNQALGLLEPGVARRLPSGGHGAAGDSPRAFPAGRVLGILAAERGRLAAERLRPFLQPRDGGDGAAGWEDAAVPWPPERGAAGSSGQEEPPGLAGELRALCREDEELMGLILGVLVASTDTLWHCGVRGTKLEKPVAAESPDTGAAGRTSCRAPAAEALHAQYRPLFWGAAGAALGHSLGVPHCGTGTAAAWELSRALAQARVPQECEEELGGLCLRLLCRGVLRSWDRDFTRALGSGLSVPGSGEPMPAAGWVRSRPALSLQRLYPALAFALRCLRALPACPPGRPPCLRLQVLGCCLATAQAAGSWLVGTARRYLAARALPQLLLLTQGDLQLLRTETDALVVLVNGIFPGPGAAPPALPPTPPSLQEHQLCQQIRSTATSIQLFSGDVLRMFSADCKRLSAEIFDQTMPLGKHWRGGPRAEPPRSPSAYAAAAAQAVLGRVLQVAWLLPRDAQAPALAQATTAFLEAWMDHILTRRIKFSLQGALQLRQDFELVRELVGSERSGLDPETRQALLALRVFQQMDGAILCLLQQPAGGAGGAPRPWRSLRRCCSDTGARPQEPSAGSPGAPAAAGTPPAGAAEPARLPGGAVPRCSAPGGPQRWLELRLRRSRRWRVPCAGGVPDA